MGAEALKAADPVPVFDAALAGVPNRYLADIMYGIVRLAQNTPPEKLQPLCDYLAGKNPFLFYRAWGYRHLGYKHYTALINQSVLFEHIPATEQWFYRNILDAFRREMQAPGERRNMLRDEIAAVDLGRQADVAAGIGMLVGAEMLFDPLQKTDYPLDSNFGRMLPPAVQEAFYKGVGMGFAETLCRYWRRLMPPDADAQKYIHGLAVEWERCRTLMAHMPSDIQPLLRAGFREELMRRPDVNDAARAFIRSRIVPALR